MYIRTEVSTREELRALRQALGAAWNIYDQHGTRVRRKAEKSTNRTEKERETQRADHLEANADRIYRFLIEIDEQFDLKRDA